MTQRSREVGRFGGLAAPFILCLMVVLLISTSLSAQAQDVPSTDAGPGRRLTGDEIVTRLEQENLARESALLKLQGTRVYRLDYQGIFGARSAEVTVRYRYSAPNEKEFSVVSQAGSKFLIDHVINGLLAAEKESATTENHERTALTKENYNFVLEETGTEYAFNVNPRTGNKFLYRGKIWVDANDFAVTRVEAEPAKNPSFWLKRSKVRQRYTKVGDFWLPAENRTESLIRMGGRAVLSIEYKDYQIVEATPLGSVSLPGRSSGPSLGRPAAGAIGTWAEDRP